MIRQYIWQQGHTLIGLGLLLVLAAQFWTVLPVVTGVALIGRGAVLSLQSGPQTSRRDSLLLVNLNVYGVLVCLAIAAQSNAVVQSPTEQISLGMLLDHATAIVILLGLIFRVFYRFSQPTS